VGSIAASSSSLRQTSLVLARRQPRALDLVGLESQHLAAALRLSPVAADRVEGGVDLAELPVGLRQRGPRVEARERVDEIEVGLRIEQALRLVLAVDRGEAGCEIAQHGHRNERPVDARPALPPRQELAPEHDLVAVLRQAVDFEERTDPRELDQRFDTGTLLARSNQVGRRALAENQPQRVDQDGLAGPGFSREQRQPGGKLDLEPGHEGDVVYFQVFNHLDAHAGARIARVALDCKSLISRHYVGSRGLRGVPFEVDNPQSIVSSSSSSAI
jgi:hypothetical protein